MARAVSTKKRLISRFFRFAWYDLTIIPTTFHPRELRREAYFFKSLIFARPEEDIFPFLSWISMAIARPGYSNGHNLPLVTSNSCTNPDCREARGTDRDRPLASYTGLTEVTPWTNSPASVALTPAAPIRSSGVPEQRR